MDKALISKVIEEAKGEEANLVIWDRRDTFTVNSADVSQIEVSDDHLKVKMEDGKATVYVQLDEVYKLVVEKDRKARAGIRAGFGATGS
jgi:formylmethanofuran dehydrogenase subunit D